ncbi:PD-(D/E)XK nuclease family protein [Fundidesulfovibrio soli]|uniref:PD-(D/E)XK nuclease family protein n=1 Tax=Fundidesulfovibrio soli TaxID=2922716 RepID=UPI001FAF7039|nr:PD-(D/E)XK nuclease family protein [Fundidesulfovibrio soli]
MPLTLSKTKLMAYISCPEKFRLRYGLRLKPLRDDPALIEGRAIHHLVESGLMYRDAIEDVLPVANMRFWESTPFETCGYDTIEDYQHAQTRCLSDSIKFLELIGPMPILAVEKDIQVPLTHPFTGEVWDSITIRGLIDLVSETESGPAVIDIKTVGRTPSMKMAAISSELALYAYLLAYPDYWDARPVEVAFLNLIRTKEPKITYDKAVLGLDEFENIVTTCRQVAASIKLGHFWKNPGMQCGWCSYKSLCHGDKQTAVNMLGEYAWEFYQMTKDVVAYQQLSPTLNPHDQAA